MKITNILYKNKFNLLTGFILLSVLTGTVSCKKQLSSEFLNPDGFTQGSTEGLFTNVEQSLGLFRPAYGEMWHTWGDYFNPMLGIGGTSSPDGYASFSWGYDPYSDAYNKLRSIRDLNINISQLPADQQTSYNPFLWTSSVIKDYLFYNLTDACGSVPYTDAMKAQDQLFRPKFDTQQDIYHALLNDLKDISGKLKGYQLGTDQVSLTFANNDILFKGQMNRWRVFTNSLRLRLALRLTNVEPDLAKSTIQDVLNDGQYVQTAADDITLVDARPQDALNNLIFRSFQERRDVLWLPQKMLNVLRKAGQPDDPRLMVLFQPDKNNAYEAMPTENADIAKILSSIDNTDLTKTFPSIYNRTTYETNYGMPYQILTSTEVHLIKAEAGVRWPDLGIDVATEYKNAIQESIDFYYAMNKLNPGTNGTGLIASAQPAKPTQATINAFIAAKATDFANADATEKKGLIFDQKYIHFNVFKPYELWADTRRLYKELGKRVINSPSNMKQMERTIYPTSESSNNADNFKTVAAANNYTTPVWWTGR